MTPRYVLVGVDDRLDTVGAARFGAEEAGSRRLGLMLAYGYATLPDRADAPGGPAADRRRRAEAAVRQVAQRVVVPATMKIETVAEDTTAVELLTRLAPGAERIVLGRHHLSIRERVPDSSLGSELVTLVDCPVVIVPPPFPRERPPRAPVVVALDGETDAHAALEAAFDEAERRQLMVIAVHAEPPTGLQARAEADVRDLAEILAGWKADHPDIAVRTLVSPAEPSDLIVQASRDAAVVVVGRPHGPAFGGWTRSVAGEVLKLARCPLIIAPPSRSSTRVAHQVR